MTRSRIIAIVVAGVLVIGAAAAFAIAWRPAIAAIDPPRPGAFDPALIKRGRDLAAIGNCNDCHTVRGGQNFAGGLPVPTPFGTIYSSNITPDAETGIGLWPEAAFLRFNSVPESIEVHIIHRPGLPFLGSGETGQGPAAASIANAITNATGKRLRNLPLTRKRIKDAIDA